MADVTNYIKHNGLKQISLNLLLCSSRGKALLFKWLSICLHQGINGEVFFL